MNLKMLVTMLYPKNEEGDIKRQRKTKMEKQQDIWKKNWEVPEGRCTLGFLNVTKQCISFDNYKIMIGRLLIIVIGE